MRFLETATEGQEGTVVKKPFWSAETGAQYL